MKKKLNLKLNICICFRKVIHLSSTSAGFCLQTAEICCCGVPTYSHVAATECWQNKQELFNGSLEILLSVTAEFDLQLVLACWLRLLLWYKQRITSVFSVCWCFLSRWAVTQLCWPTKQIFTKTLSRELIIYSTANLWHQCVLQELSAWLS